MRAWGSCCCCGSRRQLTLATNDYECEYCSSNNNYAPTATGGSAANVGVDGSCGCGRGCACAAVNKFSAQRIVWERQARRLWQRDRAASAAVAGLCCYFQVISCWRRQRRLCGAALPFSFCFCCLGWKQKLKNKNNCARRAAAEATATAARRKQQKLKKFNNSNNNEKSLAKHANPARLCCCGFSCQRDFEWVVRAASSWSVQTETETETGNTHTCKEPKTKNQKSKAETKKSYDTRACAPRRNLVRWSVCALHTRRLHFVFLECFF